MNTEELYRTLKTYFQNHLDLMRHLNINACWEYFITENSIDDENFKLHYFLFKKEQDLLEITQNDLGIKPDLILYFTEKAILKLIEGKPDADEYYARYRELMYNPLPGIQLDNKINKPRLKLLKLGYQKWQKDFKF